MDEMNDSVIVDSEENRKPIKKCKDLINVFLYKIENPMLVDFSKKPIHLYLKNRALTEVYFTCLCD
jgi:hypothetical protein